MQEEQQTKKCPYCAEEIQYKATLCKYCHSDLSKTMPKQKEAARIEDDVRAKETQNNKAEKPLKVNEKDGLQDREKKSLKSLAYIILTLIVFIFLVVFWYIIIPAALLWLIWKKTKFSKKNKCIISIAIIFIFIVFKISSDYNHRVPVITITEPSNNISVQSDKIIVKGAIDPRNSKLQIEGNQVLTKDGSFEYEARLTEENNAISLIADNSGKKTESLLMVNRILSDDEKTIVNLENIKNNDVIKLPQFEIKGSTLLESVAIKINGRDAEIKNNQFSYTIDLKEGKNNVNIVATNTKSSIVNKETLVIMRELTEEEKAKIEEEKQTKIEQAKQIAEQARIKQEQEKAKEPISILSFTGNQDVKSKEFTVASKEIKFVYSCKEGPVVCVAWLYQIGGSKQELFRGRGGKGNFSEQKTLSIGPGTFYIEMDTRDREYKIDVFQIPAPVSAEEINRTQAIVDSSQKYRNVSDFKLVDENMIEGILQYVYKTNNDIYLVDLSVYPDKTNPKFGDEFTLAKGSLKINDTVIQYAFDDGSILKPYESAEFIFVAGNKTHIGFVEKINNESDQKGIETALKSFVNALVPNI